MVAYAVTQLLFSLTSPSEKCQIESSVSFAIYSLMKMGNRWKRLLIQLPQRILQDEHTYYYNGSDYKTQVIIEGSVYPKY